MTMIAPQALQLPQVFSRRLSSGINIISPILKNGVNGFLPDAQHIAGGVRVCFRV
jgi:hypothetical protein